MFVYYQLELLFYIAVHLLKTSIFISCSSSCKLLKNLPHITKAFLF